MKFAGVFALCRTLSRHHIRILCYHGIWRGGGPFVGDSMFISLETFRSRMHWLRSSAYSVVPLQTAAELPSDGKPKVVITIDDGWYSTYADMLPVLKSLRIPATLYCDTKNLVTGAPIVHVLARYLNEVTDISSPETTKAFNRAVDLSTSYDQRHAALTELARAVGFDLGRWIDNRAFGYMTAEELRELFQAGVSVELHTHNHTLGDFSATNVSAEISENRAYLSRLLDRPTESFKHFCYPSGHFNAGVDDILFSLGISTATTLRTGLADPDSNRLLWPRILDGEQLSPLEFEAELAGVGDVGRAITAILMRLTRFR
jgi:peptidoglycan/xylan/chitin deacetylase (PgdA/CDA1 family)